MEPLVFELKSHSGPSFKGDIHLPAGKGTAPVAILCHGFKGFKDWGFFPYLADRLAEAGLVAVRMNFSMNGIGADPLALTETERFADNTITQELKDLALVCAAVRHGELPGAARMDRRRLGLLGHSRGAGTGLVRALEDHLIRAVVTWAAVETFWGGADPALWKRQGHLEVLNARTKQVLKVNYRAWEDFQAHRRAHDFAARLPFIRGRALFVHGREDVSVPPAASERLARRLGDRGLLHLVKGGDHAFGAAHPFKGATAALEDAVRVTRGFLLENL